MRTTLSLKKPFSCSKIQIDSLPTSKRFQLFPLPVCLAQYKAAKNTPTFKSKPQIRCASNRNKTAQVKPLGDAELHRKSAPQEARGSPTNGAEGAFPRAYASQKTHTTDFTEFNEATSSPGSLVILLLQQPITITRQTCQPQPHCHRIPSYPTFKANFKYAVKQSFPIKSEFCSRAFQLSHSVPDRSVNQASALQIPYYIELPST